MLSIIQNDLMCKECVIYTILKKNLRYVANIILSVNIHAFIILCNFEDYSSCRNGGNPLWILKQYKFVNEQNKLILQKSKSPIFNSLTVFYCFNIHALNPKRRWELFLILCVLKKRSFCASLKVVTVVETEKIPSEYWNNINLLMSKKISQFFKNLRVPF